MRRSKYTVDEQIRSMQEHGIKFTSCDEETARDFLTNRTYFFKLKAFENNFSKIDDQYVNLDFAYLMDLSIIDCHLRTLLNYCCLNAEHALKVRFNKLIMNDSSEDGYNIVQYFDPNGTYRFTGFGPDSRYGRSLYTEGLLQKYFNDPAVWNLWEVITFRTLCDLYEKYLEKRRFKDNVTNLFQSVRIMRNASSHNNCLLIGVRKNIRITIYTQNCLTELGRVLQTSTKVLYNPMKQYPLIHDFISTLCAFLILVDSPGVRRELKGQLNQFSNRLHKRFDYTKMQQETQLAITIHALQKVSDIVADYIEISDTDFAANKILHTQPVSIKPKGIQQIHNMALGRNAEQNITRLINHM